MRPITIKIEVLGDYHTPDERLLASELQDSLLRFLQEYCIEPDTATILVTCDDQTSRFSFSNGATPVDRAVAARAAHLTPSITRDEFNRLMMAGDPEGFRGSDY